MEATYLVLLAILPIFLIICCGTLARLLGWLNTDADVSLMKIVINLLYPALIFSNILGNDVLRKPSNLIVPPLLGLGMVLIGFTIAWIAISRFDGVNSKERRTFSFITGIQNSVYFPLPIVALLFNRETVGLLLVFNLGVEIAIWLVGVGFLLAPKEPRSLFKRVINAPVISILAATWINYMSMDRELPEFAFKTIRLLGQCTIPLGLILIGAIFTDLKTSIKVVTRIHITMLANVLRLAVLPTIFLAVAFLLPLSTELKQVIVIQAAMPCAVFPIVLTQYYSGPSDIAFKSVLSTTLISIFTMPIWIKFGIELLGL